MCVLLLVMRASLSASFTCDWLLKKTTKRIPNTSVSHFLIYNHSYHIICHPQLLSAMYCILKSPSICNSDKSKADKYKMEADKKPDGDREEKHSRKRRSRDRSRSRSHERDRSREKESKKRHKHSKDDERYKEKRQHKQDDDDRRKSHKTSSKRSWLQPHLRVRIIDSKYKKGRYYKSKVSLFR